jgi:hypothetical protein
MTEDTITIIIPKTVAEFYHHNYGWCDDNACKAPICVVHRAIGAALKETE